jgi:hypothetical protein
MVIVLADRKPSSVWGTDSTRSPSKWERQAGYGRWQKEEGRAVGRAAAYCAHHFVNLSLIFSVSNRKSLNFRRFRRAFRLFRRHNRLRFWNSARQAQPINRDVTDTTPESVSIDQLSGNARTARHGLALFALIASTGDIRL